MAFQDVSSFNDMLKLTGIGVGESVTGYLLGIKPSPKGGFFLIMRIGEDTQDVTASGNIKYLVMDGALKLGLNTQITRQPDTKVKGMKSTSFQVQQDPDDSVAITELAPKANLENAAAARSIQSVADKISAIKG
jgi:hypothetical protein